MYYGWLQRIYRLKVNATFFFKSKEQKISPVLCGRKKNEAIRNANIFVNFCSNETIFQVRIRKDHKFFFPRINELIGRLLREISAKIHFFTFFKSCKKSTLTSIFAISKNWLYGFSWFLEIQVKHSIAIFSAIQNSIWTFFNESKEISKMFIFAFFDDFFSIFLTILCI